jgi:hypothetical protein
VPAKRLSSSRLQARGGGHKRARAARLRHARTLTRTEGHDQLLLSCSRAAQDAASTHSPAGRHAQKAEPVHEADNGRDGTSQQIGAEVPAHTTGGGSGAHR